MESLNASRKNFVETFGDLLLSPEQMHSVGCFWENTTKTCTEVRQTQHEAGTCCDAFEEEMLELGAPLLEGY
jgi:hypothetical protein